MKFFAPFLSTLAVLQPLTEGSTVPHYFRPQSYTLSSLDVSHIQHDLGDCVSNTTTIFGRDDARFENGTERWSLFDAPMVQLVIEPGEESDVSSIVKYCNQNSIEFLAYNKGHGWTKTLGDFNGIQINLVNLRNIHILPGGQSAWFQGGLYGGDVTSYLWSEGYVATTGACACVGLMGAGLGGGHGRLEGLYGMISDNILQLNVVLADGSTVLVNGSNEHRDLYWGMRGAGHNFGIVTSFEMKIYPRGPDTWHYKNYIWRGSELEAVFEALNGLNGNGTTPVNMAANQGYFSINSTIATQEPVITWTFAYRGSADDAAGLLAPFDAIVSTYQESGDVSYPEVAHAQSSGELDPVCQEDAVRITSNAGLQVYNITAERQIWATFAEQIASNFELAQVTNVLHEGYSTEAVEAQNPSDSAYPFREDHHLVLFQSDLAPGSNATLQHAAWKWAQEVRALLNDGQPGRLPHAYVNYANGFEGVHQWYGYESWRIDRLCALKHKYDPQNRFRFYNPIA